MGSIERRELMKAAVVGGVALSVGAGTGVISTPNGSGSGVGMNPCTRRGKNIEQTANRTLPARLTSARPPTASFSASSPAS